MVNVILGGSGVTDFSPEFGGAVAGFEPVSRPLFLGVDPMLAAFALLLLLIVGAAAWWLGKIEGARNGPDTAPAEIHKMVLEASQSALAAPSNLIHQKAQALRAMIDSLLGPVLVVANGLGSAVKKLDEALKGEVKDESPAKPATQGHAATSPSGCSCGHEAKPGACTCGAAPAAAAANALAFNHVTIVGLTPTACAPAASTCATPPAPDKPKTRKMAHEEQVEALAKAVRAFHDHWSQSDARIRELKAARAALSKVPPRHAGHGSGHDAHGGHADLGGKRAWDH